jgi:hypothetical protein
MDNAKKVSHYTNTFKDKMKYVSVYHVQKCDLNCVGPNKMSKRNK